MAEEKKTVPAPTEKKQPETTKPAPGAEKKTTETPKPTVDAKVDSEKKSVTQDKATADIKSPPPAKTEAETKPAGSAAAATTKAEAEKKTPEQPKPAADTKAEAEKKSTVQDKGAADVKSPPPSKTEADKKPAAPAAKADTEKKASETPKPAQDAKAEAEKKPAIDKKEPPTAPSKAEESIDPKGMQMPMGIAETDKVTMMNLTDLHRFEGHPYKVEDNKDMFELVESIKQFGVMEPAVVIPRKEGGYEMVSGHRRWRACQLAGLTTMPVIVRNLDRDEATISMVDANLKRENISPMEKARAYEMKLEAMKRKAGRRSKMDILSGKAPLRADEELAQQVGESRATIQRLTRLTKLEPELQDMVDEKKLPVNTAAEISYLKPAEQKVLADAIKREDKVPSGTQATALKEESKAGKLTTEKIQSTVGPTKKELNPELKVTFNNDELRPYFPDKGTTVATVKRTMFEAMDLRQKALARQAAKTAEKNAPAKKSPGVAR